MKKDIKEYKNLVIVEKPFKDIDNPNNKKNRTMKNVYYDIENLYYEGFNLTINEIMDILKCSRLWVERNIIGEIKYMYISTNFYNALVNACIRYNIDENIMKELSKGKYYFSRNDFYSWLLKNTKAERQTIVIDLRNYAEDKKEFDSIVAELNESNLKKDKLRLVLKLYDTLNKAGKKLESIKPNSTKRGDIKSIEVKLNSIEDIPKVFTSIKELKRTSNELVYRELFEKGAIKYTILDSLVRYDHNNYLDLGDMEYPELVSYNLYVNVQEKKSSKN